MLSMQPPKRIAPADELIIDASLGACLLVVILVCEFALFALPGSRAGRGRDLFIAGALGLIVFLFLALGYLRGQSEGNLWLKALCICAAILTIGVNPGRLSLLIVGLTFPPTALGIWLRRRGFALWPSRNPSGAND